VAGEQVTKEAVQLARRINEISKAMSEQSTASAEITQATQDMRLQSEQVAKAMREQARTAHEMTLAVASVSKEALRVTNSNRNHLDLAEKVRNAVAELRHITARNSDGVKETLTRTSGLADRARELGEIMDSMAGRSNGSESQPLVPTKRKRPSKAAAATDGSE
jgi:methyl-accepting chemotaxis protein